MDTYLAELKRTGKISKIAGYRFGHGELYSDLNPALLCSYHPSQQNTSTGRLTQQMLDDLFAKARRIVGRPYAIRTSSR
jgi:uracil-DNA glycosylase